MSHERSETRVVPYLKRRHLIRSVTDKKIAGIAGGMAEYFGIDPTMVRVGRVIAGFMGWGLLAYVVCWIVIPQAAVSTAETVGGS
jgi:phage shock protein C